MPFGLKTLVDRFKGRAASLPSVDLLASNPSPTDALESRLNWLVDLVQWIRRPGQDDAAPAMPGGNIQAGRLRRFLDVLDRNSEWKVMLGLLPELAFFAGIPLDVCHVTFSSGSIAAAVATLGTSVISTSAFWLVVTGTLMIGGINVAVSFSLAIRARGVQVP